METLNIFYFPNRTTIIYLFTIIWKSPWVTIFPYQPSYLIFIWRVEEKSLDILDVVESLSPCIFPTRPWQSTYLTKWIIWMNLSLLKLPPSSKGKMPLYVKALMSSRSYLYEKIGNYLDRVREIKLQWLLTLNKWTKLLGLGPHSKPD